MASNIDVLNESTRVAQEAAKMAGLNFQPGATVVGGQIKPTNIPAPLINTNQTNLQFPTTGSNTDLASALAATKAMSTALTSQRETDLAKEQAGYTSELKTLLGRQEQKPLTVNQALEQAGATKITKELQDLEGQIATRTAALESGLTNIEGKAIPMELLTGEQAQLRRQGLAEIGTLQARQQVLQGNLAAAKDAAQRAVDLIYAPEEARIKNIQTFLELNQAELTKEEKKKADLLTEALRVQSEELANKKTLQTYALNASANYPDAGILPSDDVQTVNNKIQKSSIYRTERAKASAGIGNNVTGNLSPLSLAVIENPQLFSNLTATNKGMVISELQNAGYDTTNLAAKPLSDTAINSISQSQKAIAELNNLKTIISGNEQYLGPISGFQRLNPWSKARQVQSDVDRVRQTVGKALEGGVLRKEDEEKYKKILATLNDTPETAVYKIDALISSITRDVENYSSLQQSAGKSLDVGASLQKKGETPTAESLRKKYNY